MKKVWMNNTTRVLPQFEMDLICFCRVFIDSSFYRDDFHMKEDCQCIGTLDSCQSPPTWQSYLLVSVLNVDTMMFLEMSLRWPLVFRLSIFVLPHMKPNVLTILQYFHFFMHNLDIDSSLATIYGSTVTSLRLS